MTNGRPKTAGDRAEDDMKVKARRLAATSKDPIERLRYHCLARGNTGILALGRYISSNRQQGSVLKKRFLNSLKAL